MRSGYRTKEKSGMLRMYGIDDVACDDQPLGVLIDMVVPALVLANIITASSLTRHTECRLNQIRFDQ